LNGAKLWPLAIVGVLVITVVANVAVLYEAGDRDAAAVEPDYYQKAVAWDSTLAQRTRDVALGWRLAAEFGAPGRDGTPLTVRLTDARGEALADAAIRVEAIHNAEGSRRLHAVLRPAPDGAYAAPLPLAHRGLWELRFEVVRHGERFTATLRREAGGPGS
jgi:nitrogen fixation protein FixH